MNPFSVQSALDAGAVGVIVPQIANYEAACAAVEMIRYAPRGVRGFNPFTRAARYGRGGGGTDDESVLAGLIIENKTAFDDLERIVSIPELDIVYLGVYDMSVALGCAGDVHHPEVIAFVEAAIPVILEGGKTVGLMIHDTNAILYYAALGVRFFVYSVDTIVIGRSFERLAVGFRSATTSVADGEGSGGST